MLKPFKATNLWVKIDSYNVPKVCPPYSYSPLSFIKEVDLSANNIQWVHIYDIMYVHSYFFVNASNPVTIHKCEVAILKGGGHGKIYSEFIV